MHRFSTAAKGRAENRACLADRTYLGQAAWSVLKAALDVCWWWGAKAGKIVFLL